MMLERALFEQDIKELINELSKTANESSAGKKKIILENLPLILDAKGLRFEGMVTMEDSDIWIDTFPPVSVTVPIEENEEFTLGEPVLETDVSTRETREALENNARLVLPTTENIKKHLEAKYGKQIASIRMDGDIFEIRFKKAKAGIEAAPEPESLLTEEKINNASDEKLVTAIQELSAEDQTLLATEMQVTPPMDFEDSKVKTSIRTFLKNQIVKLASGFEVPEKIKGLVKGVTGKLLLTTGLFLLWEANGSFIKPKGIEGNMSLLKNQELVAGAAANAIELADPETFNQLSENGQRVYLYCTAANDGKSYVIVDKPRAMMYLIGSDRKMIHSMPVLLGAMKGEEPNTSVVGEPTKKGATTPAGKYTIGKRKINSGDSLEYRGRIFDLYGTNGLAMHMTYPGDFARRTQAINSPTAADNRMSYGCINISPEHWDKYIKTNFPTDANLYILPDDPMLYTLNPKSGNLEKTALSNTLASNNK